MDADKLLNQTNTVNRTRSGRVRCTQPFVYSPRRRVERLILAESVELWSLINMVVGLNIREGNIVEFGHGPIRNLT